VRAEVVSVLPAASTAASAAAPAEIPPAVPERFPKLLQLQVPELQHLQANSLALDDWIHEHDQVQELKARLKKVRQENNEMAASILRKEPELEEAKRKQTEINEAIAKSKGSLEALIAKRDEILKKRSPETLGATLAARAHQSDEAAEEILNKALEAPTVMDAAAITDFRQRFMKEKMEKHTRLALKASLEPSSA